MNPVVGRFTPTHPTPPLNRTDVLESCLQHEMFANLDRPTDQQTYAPPRKIDQLRANRRAATLIIASPDQRATENRMTHRRPLRAPKARCFLRENFDDRRNVVWRQSGRRINGVGAIRLGQWSGAHGATLCDTGSVPVERDSVDRSTPSITRDPTPREWGVSFKTHDPTGGFTPPLRSWRGSAVCRHCTHVATPHGTR